MAHSLHRTFDKLSGFMLTKNYHLSPSHGEGLGSVRQSHRKSNRQLSSETVQLVEQKPLDNFLSVSNMPTRVNSLTNLTVPTPEGSAQKSRSLECSPVYRHDAIVHQRSLSAEDVSVIDGSISTDVRTPNQTQTSQISEHITRSEYSEDLPLLQCSECDQTSYVNSEQSSLSVGRDDKDEDNSSCRVRHPSTQSLPESSMTQPPDTNVQEDNDVKDITEQHQLDSDEIINTKLFRKKALKIRRHPTEDNSDLCHEKMAVRGHTRSLSYQDVTNLDGTKSDKSHDGGDIQDKVTTLEHGDSGIVINAGHCENSPLYKVNLMDSVRRQCSIDSSGIEAQSVTEKAFVYSEKEKMPVLDGPSPTQTEFSAEGICDHLSHIDTSQLVVSYRIGRDGGGPIIKKAKTDTGHDRPYPFTRKHSTPAMYALKSASQKLNLGNVECFQIHFDIIEELTKETDVELVPAIRGVTLREAVNSYLSKRGLTFDMVDFFIAASQSPLQVDTADCYFLAGADLHVRAKQTVDSPYGKTNHTVANKTNVKVGKTSRTEPNVPEAVSPHGTLKGNQPLKGITKIFGVTKKSDQLNEILQSYSHNGWPPMPDLLQLGQKKFDPAIFKLEDSWTEIVKEPQKCNRYQQEAIWELLKTEVAYIRDLQLVINLFLATLYNLQSHELLNDIETEKIFSNIADLHQHNCLFYETHMYKIVSTARETGQPLDPTPLIKGFTEFRSFFEAYSRFCIDYMRCQQYLVRMKEENELFKAFLSWAENQPECNRLSLRDYIGKPFQRLTKYKLLLERIWREPRSDHVQAMISKVDQFICQVNATVTQLEIMRRIDSYDAVDLPNNDSVAKLVGSFSRLDLTTPIPGTNRTRFLLEEGTLRMNNRTDVICFLFTDMLLITKATSKKVDVGSKVKVKVYKPPMRLDKVFIKQLNDGGFMLIYFNEYSLPTTAYTFHGDPSRLWFERLGQAQAEYEKLRNAIMDQSEAYLLNRANGYEYEDEYAYMNARSVAMEMALGQPSVNRNTSVSSADSSVISEGIRSEGRRPSSVPGSEVDKLRIRSAVTLHGQNRDRSPQNSPPVSPLVSQYVSSSAINSYQNSHHDQSLGRLDPSTGPSLHLAKQSQTVKEYNRMHQHSSISSEDTSQKLPTRIAHDDLKKLKQRRDRRYFTADMIQDLHHGKDASIQKRLSWHCGAKDTDYECKQRMVKNKTISSDSVRSMYSSSGISSVGSLQQNQDQEISEEGDLEWSEQGAEDLSLLDSDMAARTNLTPSKHELSLRNSVTPSELNVSCPGKSDNGSMVTATNLTSQSIVSKSMPDISRLCLEDGAASVDQHGVLVDIIREGQRRKLSDIHSKRLKLQLLNSTLEATDV